MNRRTLFATLAALAGGTAIAKALPPMDDPLPVPEAPPVPSDTTFFVGELEPIWGTSPYHRHANYDMPAYAVVVGYRIYAGNGAWLECDGRWEPIEKYQRLYAVLGTAHGPLMSSDTPIGSSGVMFKLPNWQGRSGAFPNHVHSCSTSPALPEHTHSHIGSVSGGYGFGHSYFPPS